MMEEILANVDFNKVFAVISTIGAAVLAYLNKKKDNTVKDVKVQNEILKDNIYHSKIKTIKELFDFQRFSSLQAILSKMFKSGPIDRFTLMFVMNGKIDFHYMTVLMDESIIAESALNEISPYSRFMIDQKYAQIIKETELGRFVWRQKPNFDAGSINDFLELENINSICWAFVERIKLDNANDVVVYCSFSSESGPLNRVQKKLIELTYIGKIKPHILQILKVPDEGDSYLLNHLSDMIPEDQDKDI